MDDFIFTRTRRYLLKKWTKLSNDGLAPGMRRAWFFLCGLCFRHTKKPEQSGARSSPTACLCDCLCKGRRGRPNNDKNDEHKKELEGRTRHLSIDLNNRKRLFTRQ
jgi:hypothetical protein